MTGWTQFTVRFEEEQHADALQEDVAGGDLFGECRASYNETLGPIARVRLVGYDNHDTVVRLLENAGPFDLALVADFNDTTDSGEITVYGQGGRIAQRGETVGDGGGNLYVMTRASCPEVGRWSFELTVEGLTETGIRAGNDFSLEQQYGESDKQMVPLEEMERLCDEQLMMLKEAARVVAAEYERNP